MSGTEPSDNYFLTLFSWVLRPVETQWFASKLQGKCGVLGVLNCPVNSLAYLRRKGSVSHCRGKAASTPWTNCFISLSISYMLPNTQSALKRTQEYFYLLSLTERQALCITRARELTECRAQGSTHSSQHRARTCNLRDHTDLSVMERSHQTPKLPQLARELYPASLGHTTGFRVS